MRKLNEIIFYFKMYAFYTLCVYILLFYCEKSEEKLYIFHNVLHYISKFEQREIRS